MDKLSALMQALKMTGKAGYDIGKGGLKKGMELSKANPRAASAVGGAAGGAALAKILGGASEPEEDAFEQEEALKRMRFGGM